MRILITGGSGYLGQFLIVSLREQYTIGFTYLEHNVNCQEKAGQPFKVNLATGEGLQAAVLSFKPQVVINCAAISQPAVCERDYEACRALNVPKQLVTTLQQLQQLHSIDALLIHISTDQVYDGSKSDWKETDPTDPVNAYGRSKLEAEHFLQQAWPGRYVALRASLIYGPEPPLQPVGRPLFIQFVEQVLSQGKETSFFVDEFRSAVYVYDICNVIKHIIGNIQSTQQQPAALPRQQQQCNAHTSSAAAVNHDSQNTTDSPSPAAAVAAGGGGGTVARPGRSVLGFNLPHFVYNMGGPDCLSRHDMALAVAAQCGHSTAAIKEANSAEVQRGYNSPRDISMNMQRLLRDMPDMKLTPFAEGLEHIFPQAKD